MRPELIEIEGFGAFKGRTVVDFTDVELFGFTGPTGSGKSTLIDAMVFALYGSVPRYDDNRLVAPAISQGQAEAKVHLRFSVNARTYTAVRIVRRTKTGATTKEARLESGDEVIAGDVKALDAAIEALLGLDLDQFTTCVVLPQGQFATLLHATPKERQALLVRLLDLGRYGRMGKRARAIASEATTLVDRLEGELAGLADATDEAHASAAERVAAFDALLVIVENLVPQLEAADRGRSEIDTRLAAIERARTALIAVAAPSDVPTVAQELDAASAEATNAIAGTEEATSQVAGAEAALATLGDVELLRRRHQAQIRRADLLERIQKGRSLVEESQVRLTHASSTVDAATAALVEATTRLDEVRRAHAVAEAAGHLDAGDECPVCGSVIVELVDHDRSELDEAIARRDSTANELTEAERVRADTRAEAERFSAKLEERETELAEVVAELAGAPDAGQLEATLRQVDAAVATLDAARRVERDAQERLARANRRVDAARAAERTARLAFGGARDIAARAAIDDVAPPTPTDDLAGDWAALLAWCGQQVTDADRQTAVLVDRRAEISSMSVDGHQRLALAFDSLDVHPPPPEEATRLATRHANDAHQSLARISERIERRVSVEADLERQAETASVHKMLGSLLSTTGFEQWLLGEALDALVEGASAWLGELSSGAYALAVDEDGREFFVIDRRDADQRRLAKTLSGGETFLASLALALALAERISELAAEGAPRLESIFLDEGFGTLDPQTLDVVASAIEELGATGRMVGVISHVADLAERLPTVYEVAKTAETSTVERVDR